MNRTRTNQAGAIDKKLLVAVGVTGIIGLILGGASIVSFCDRFPNRCPIMITPVSTNAKLILDDIHAAVWMAFDSGWVENLGHYDPTKPENAVCGQIDLGSTPTQMDVLGPCGDTANWEHPDNDRPGIVFQAGSIVPDTLELNLAQSHFKWIEIEFVKNGVTDTAKYCHPHAVIPGCTAQYDWIDIAAVSKPCPIDALNAYGMLDERAPGQLPDISATQVKTYCDGATATLGAKDVTMPCIQGRALHHSLFPDRGLVTYWPGSNMYEMEVEPHSIGGDPLFRYTFDLLNEVRADIWLKGCWRDRLEDVSRIHLVFHHPGDSSTHDDFHNPPMNGKSFAPR